MNISWHWLGELIDINDITPEQLSEHLTLAGFELENINYNVDNDTLLQISCTANRADTTYVIGILQEIASILQRTLDLSKTQINIPVFKQSINTNVSYQEKYITSIIHDVQIQESPEWLKNRLALYQIKSINNLSDILNFIWIKWAQHIHVVDLDEVSKQVNINNLHHLQTNRDIRQIHTGNHSDQLRNNKNIILQLSIPTSNDQSSSQLSHATHSLDVSISEFNHNHSMEAYLEAVILINELCQTKFPEKIVHISTHNHIRTPITFSYDKSNKILGPATSHTHQDSYKTINPNTVDKIFHQLNFITHSQITKCYLEVPLYRLKDIERDIDIIEEISRLYGFNYFSDQLPTSIQKGVQSTYKHRINQIRSICRSIGLHEVIHTSIGNHYETLIYNPLNIENSSLRSNLLSKLIQSSTYNLKHTKKSIEMFEIGRVFIANEKKYNEMVHLAGILGGNKYIRREWADQPQNISWFQAKGDVEELFERLDLNITWTSNQNEILTHSIFNISQNYFKTNRYAVLYDNNQNIIGLFGELNIQDTNIATVDSLYGFELTLESLLDIKASSSFTQVRPYTKYPSVIRDIKIDVPYNFTIDQIFKNINMINESIIESIDLFDVYQKHNQQNKSLGFRITYSKSNGTLTTQEVNEVEQKLKNICIPYT
uniref:phenylalanine--tRNA ligase n=1 Tax=Neoizziella asiatica TaxID=1077397 RepID=A0A1G4NX95_9FLOR|nr:Phenylalanine-tRNA ligase beta subunit [Neoizziella asiatica]SCW23278.1 Phenylalanine-tRNA ligase beta subunit [Neoizziella asiatica]